MIKWRPNHLRMVLIYKNGPKSCPSALKTFRWTNKQINGKKDQNGKREGSKNIQTRVALNNVNKKSILKQGLTPPLEFSQVPNEFLLTSIQKALLLKKELSFSLGKRWKNYYTLSPVEENFLKFKSCHLPHFLNVLPPPDDRKKSNFKRVSFESLKKTKKKYQKKSTPTQLNVMITGLDFQTSKFGCQKE